MGRFFSTEYSTNIYTYMTLLPLHVTIHTKYYVCILRYGLGDKRCPVMLHTTACYYGELLTDLIVQVHFT
jgi:hypothetical protein